MSKEFFQVFFILFLLSVLFLSEIPPCSRGVCVQMLSAIKYIVFENSFIGIPRSSSKDSFRQSGRNSTEIYWEILSRAPPIPFSAISPGIFVDIFYDIPLDFLKNPFRKLSSIFSLELLEVFLQESFMIFFLLWIILWSFYRYSSRCYLRHLMRNSSREYFRVFFRDFVHFMEWVLKNPWRKL